MIVIEPLGDCGLLVQFGEKVNEDVQMKVTAFSKRLAMTQIAGFVDYIPAYTTVTIIYNPLYFSKSREMSPFDSCKETVDKLLKTTVFKNIEKKNSLITIPICYGGQYGPDLITVAKEHSLSEEAVIKIHSEAEYTVSMIGFAPGFPYLNGLNEQIATPRLATPRKEVAKGSVGIAGTQTGIYSISSPGGWQIIGRTPVSLFDHQKTEPSLLQQGDRVRFNCISEAQFDLWEVKEDEYRR
ncbi:MAG: 5-oxoprolinase subunit PxpB [Anaerobacillus sp.]|uniref:5-oxoprolinase subunit PxpB n=1 Tax=Anaerobacillus sp. TaxID=1872506 RepID=UPI00391ADFE6